MIGIVRERVRTGLVFAVLLVIAAAGVGVVLVAAGERKEKPPSRDDEVRPPRTSREDIRIDLRDVASPRFVTWAVPPELPEYADELQGLVEGQLVDVADDGTFVAGKARYRIDDGSFVVRWDKTTDYNALYREWKEGFSPSKRYRVDRTSNRVAVQSVDGAKTVLTFAVDPLLDQVDHGEHSRSRWLDDDTFVFDVRSVSETRTSNNRSTVWDVPSAQMIASLETERTIGFWFVLADGHHFMRFGEQTPLRERSRAVHIRDGNLLDVPGELIAVSDGDSWIVSLDKSPALLFLDGAGHGFRVPIEVERAGVRVLFSDSGRYAVWSNDRKIGAIDLDQGILYGGAALIERAQRP